MGSDSLRCASCQTRAHSWRAKTHPPISGIMIIALELTLAFRLRVSHCMQHSASCCSACQEGNFQALDNNKSPRKNR